MSALAFQNNLTTCCNVSTFMDNFTPTCLTEVTIITTSKYPVKCYDLELKMTVSLIAVQLYAKLVAD